MSRVAPPPREGPDDTGPHTFVEPDSPVATRGASDQLAVFEAVFGQSPIGVGVFDPQCCYLRVNQAYQEIVGLPVGQLLGRRVDEVLGPLGEAIAAKLRQAMSTGVPLVNQEMAGSTYAHDGEPRAYLASYFRLADDSGALLGGASVVTDVTEQRKVRDDLAVANRKLALLGRVSEVLSASLDVGVTLSAFAHLVVPSFADHCIVDMLEEETGLVRRVALVHAPDVPADAGAWTLPDQVVSYPDGHPTIVAIRTGQCVIEHTDGDPDFLHIAPSPASADFGRLVGIRSAMTVPLVARGVVLGAVSFVTSVSGRVLSDDDVELAEQLAARAAVCIDNARLFAREQRIALTLQRSLLPDQLPDTPGLETAAVYRPAAHEGAVGGDWYDVIPLPCGRVGLVMGDVMGRGVPAAALMGQVRAAVRAYAAQDLPPGVVLQHLDALVAGLDDDVLVSCVYAVYDPVEEALCIANAGHPPPLLMREGEAPRRLEPHGVLLGAGGGATRYGQVEMSMVAGDVLALYTDGLVERRHEDIDRCIDVLQDVLQASHDSLPRVCAAVVDALAGPEQAHDDVALMLVQPCEDTRPLVTRLDVVPHASNVHQVRQFAASTLSAWGEPPDVAEAVQLLVSELVTNVIRHASGHSAAIRLERHVDRLVVAVIDPDPAPPRVGRPSLDAEEGRGLHLVEAVAARWGTRSLVDGGKLVWCELPSTRRP